MLDRIGYGLAARAAGGAPIDPQALAFDYPGGRVDLFVARLEAAPRDLSPARAALAQRLAARRAGCDSTQVVIGHSNAGAPRLLAPQMTLAVSLAGRGDLVAAAIAGRPVGVDIESVGTSGETPVNVLHPAERLALATAGALTHELFLRIWTAKEAYVKAVETGLMREPAEIEVRFAARRSTTFVEAGDFQIFDRNKPVAASLARAGLAEIAGARAMLACIVL